MCDPDICAGQFRACQEGAAEVGRKLEFGQGVGLVREVIVADTDEEAIALGKESGCFIWTKFFEPFGFNAALMRVGEDYHTIPNTFDSMVERGLTICGSPDTVSRKFAAIFKKLARRRRVHYLDIGPRFLQDDGTLSREIMPDLLHLSEKGYTIWAESIEPTLKKLMGEK